MAELTYLPSGACPAPQWFRRVAMGHPTADPEHSRAIWCPECGAQINLSLLRPAGAPIDQPWALFGRCHTCRSPGLVTVELIAPHANTLHRSATAVPRLARMEQRQLAWRCGISNGSRLSSAGPVWLWREVQQRWPQFRPVAGTTAAAVFRRLLGTEPHADREASAAAYSAAELTCLAGALELPAPSVETGDWDAVLYRDVRALCLSRRRSPQPSGVRP